MASTFRSPTKRLTAVVCLLAVSVTVALYGFSHMGFANIAAQPRTYYQSTRDQQTVQKPTYHQAASVYTQDHGVVTPQPNLDDGPKVKVIILTRMRSGSSFTGKVFNNHPDVFYFYEPLWWIDGYRKGNIPADFFNRSPINLKKLTPGALDALRVELLNVSLGCQFEFLYVRPLMHLTFSLTKSFQPYKRCSDDHPGVLGMIRCLPVLRHRCTNASVAVAKTIRLPMRLARRLLTSDPAYRVIHLVRDPRGVLHSMNTSGLAKDKFQGVSPRRLCDEVQQDLEESERLKKQFPGRVLTVRYEDLARELQPLSRRLLNFSGLAMHPSLDHYLRSVASPKGKPSPERVSLLWRQRVRWPAVEKINAVCSPVFRLAGYLPLNASSLPDLGQPSYRPQGEVPGLREK